MAGGYVEYDGGRLWYQQAGRGPAVLLLHAGGADRRMWDGHLERPQRTWALVVVASGPRGIDDIAPDPRLQAFAQAIAAGDRDRAAELFIEMWVPLRTSPELDGRIRRMVQESIGMLEVRPKGLLRMPEWSAAERLGEIGVPTLAIWGDRDLPEVGLVGERLVAGVPGARRVVLQGVDHFVPMRAPDRFAREVLAFLDEAAPGAARG
jgi:pimeloyl-ACP methyl ester carboxylesterase